MECKQDEYAKSMILHSITRCVYLLEAEVRARKQEGPPSQPGPWGLRLIPTPLPGQTLSWDLSLWLMAGGLVTWGAVGRGHPLLLPLLSLLAHSRPPLVPPMTSAWWAPCWMTRTTVSKSKL